MTSLTDAQIAQAKAAFGRDGAVILPGFFASGVIDQVQAATERVKRERPRDVVIDNLHNGERTLLGLMSPAQILHDRMKVNDLYLTTPEVRDLALAAALVPVLRALLNHTPALCNSLYLERSSTQSPHIDALYMTPRTPGHLIAAWIAAEDATGGSGQLEYFPGSHRIPMMTFSDGRHHFIQDEMANWERYIEAAIAAAGLQKLSFPARKGDVLFWHANLLHGGGAITNPALTRKSHVFHYFSEGDARQAPDPLVAQAGAYWIDRPPQALPLDVAMRLPFSETRYLKRHPDVAAAVKSGGIASGALHYERYGRAEGRLPC